MGDRLDTNLPVNEDLFTNDQTLKVTPARAETFFRPMSIPLKWSMQVAGRVPCITVTKWIAGVKIRLQ
jgi:hypothetical protein